MKLALRAVAERDLDRVFDYSVDVHGPDLAERYMRDLQAGMNRLLDHPGLGAETALAWVFVAMGYGSTAFIIASRATGSSLRACCIRRWMEN